MFILSVLILDSTFQVKVGGNLSSTFNSSLGVVQGDGLSPLLFILYLEAALRDLRKELLALDFKVFEWAFADDITLGSFDSRIMDVMPLVVHAFKPWNLIVNFSKLEKVTMSPSSSAWKSVRLLGSLLGSSEDILRRLKLSRWAFSRLWALWLRHHKVPLALRFKLLSAFVTPVLTFGAHLWGATEASFEKVEAQMRKFLRT